MPATFEIPLSGANQTFAIPLNGVSYILRFIFCQTTDPSACWLVDINDANSNPIVCGIPLVTGADLLEQYQYLNFGFSLYCFSDFAASDIPTFANLGTTSHVFVQTPPIVPATVPPATTSLIIPNTIIDLGGGAIIDLFGNQEVGVG